MNKPEPVKSSSLPKLLIVGFSIIMIVVIIFKLKSIPHDDSQILIAQGVVSEKIIDIENSEEPQNYVQTPLKKEGYNLWDKPFDIQYYEYDERTKDFRLVCTSPCPVPKEILDQEFAAIAYAVSTLRGLTQSDIHKELLPFEVHASEDAVCAFMISAAAYASGWFIDGNGLKRGLVCFFFDKVEYDRSKFPYSTSVHEITHLFEFEKIEHKPIVLEGLSEVMDSFFLKGNDKNSFCWNGNAWYKLAAYNNHDPHWIGGDLFFELCRQYGFDYDDLPALFAEIDRRGYVSIHEFVDIINSIVGADTSQLFRGADVI